MHPGQTVNVPQPADRIPNNATRISLLAMWFAGLCVVATFGATAIVRIALRGLDYYGLAWELLFGIAVLLASMVMRWASGMTGAHELLITLFLFITAPVSANLMAQAAIHLKVPSKAGDAPGSDPRD